MTARVAALQTSSGAWERGALRVAPNVERAVGCGGRFGAVRTFAAGYSRESTVRPRVNDEVGVVERDENSSSFDLCDWLRHAH